MRAQGLETLFPKYLTPHTAYDTNKVNICVDISFFKRKPGNSTFRREITHILKNLL